MFKSNFLIIMKNILCPIIDTVKIIPSPSNYYYTEWCEGARS